MSPVEVAVPAHLVAAPEGSVGAAHDQVVRVVRQVWAALGVVVVAAAGAAGVGVDGDSLR